MSYAHSVHHAGSIPKIDRPAFSPSFRSRSTGAGGHGPHRARQLAERIRQEVGAQTHDSAKGAFRATLSLGVAVYPEDGKSKQESIANADQALYAAKHGGRNRTVCHGELVRAKDEPPPARAAAG